jgi:hemoglobin
MFTRQDRWQAAFMTSVYEQIGGRESVAAAVDLFYCRATADPVLAPYFEGLEMRRQKAHMRAFLAVALGGPEVYGGRDMHAAHATLGITHEAFNRVIGHLVATLVELDVPDTLIVSIGQKVEPLRSVVVAGARAA